jgi:hypothetical protein
MAANIWTWESHNTRTRQRMAGQADSLNAATDAAEAAHDVLGFRGVVTTMTTPRGHSYTWRPGARSGFMVWEKQ